MKKRLISLLLMAASVTSLFAVPAKPGLWKTLKLTNGQTVEVQLMGDEFMKFWQDKNGNNYSMTPNGLQMANMNELRQRSTELRAESATSFIAKDGIYKVNARTQKAKKVAYKGNKRCLILLVQFANMKFSMNDPKAYYNRVANEEGFSEGKFRGSLRDYYRDQSHGQFNLTFDVVGPYTLSNYENYGSNDPSTNSDSNPRGMVTAACQNAANEGVDFSPYDWDNDGYVDMVFVIYAGQGEASGGGANTIWPHKSVLYQPTQYGNKMVYVYACGNEMASSTSLNGIGTICHEFSHCLGFPDFYDVEYKGFYGMGSWDLMCQGSYNGGSFCPPNYTAYEKWVAGWLNPVELHDNVEVSNLATVAKGGHAYKFTNPAFRDEYYFIENRQREGWDEALQGAGIMVQHINYDAQVWALNRPNTNNPDYNTYERCTIIPADNSKKSEDEKGDLWPYGSRKSLSSSSKPSAIAQHPNTDGKNLMNIALTNMAIADDGTASFKFTNYNLTSSQEGYIFHETFDKCQGTGGNDGSFAPVGLSLGFATSDFASDEEGWTCTYQKGGSQCGRFGKTNSTTVTVTTPTIKLEGIAKLTLKCAPLGKKDANLTVSADKAELSANSIALTQGKWNEFSAQLKGEGDVKLTFTVNGPFFLDDVFVASETNGIEAVENVANSSDYTVVYNMQGQEVYKAKSADFNFHQIPAHGMFILKQGNKTIKVAK